MSHITRNSSIRRLGTGICCVMAAMAMTLPQGAQAESLSPDQALARLQGSSTARFAPAKGQMRLIAQPDQLYVFSSGTGFVVAPANDVAPAMLGYADSGEFSPQINPELAYWLDFYAREIKYAAAHSAPAYSAVARTQRQAIAPLLVTKWNQEAPYNDLCPLQDGERCVTGCVATAMSQVIYFHQWPSQGKGTHSYYWQNGDTTLSFNYGATTFDYADMTPTYSSSSTDAQRQAVAELMSAAGISINMAYSPSESGASTRTMGQSLIDYFDYDKGLVMPMREYYGLQEWEDMVYGELAQGRPVLYCGQGSAGGHQFVCDGYSQDGYFHFNWGWGGLSNGYFLLTALNPPALGVGGGAGGFNSGQEITVGLRRPVEGSDYRYLVYATGDFATTNTSLQAHEAVSFGGSYYNFSMTSTPADGALGVRIVSTGATPDTTYVKGTGMANIKPLYGHSNITVSWPALADGSYVVTPALYAGGQWSDIRATLDSYGKYLATVSGGTTTLTHPAKASLQISGLALTSGLYLDNYYGLSFTATNPGPGEMFIGVEPALISSDGTTLVALSASDPMDLMEGESQTVNYSGVFAAAQNSYGQTQQLTAGQYLLALLDSSTGTVLGTPIEVTVNAAPAQTEINVTDFAIEGGNVVTDPAKVVFDVSVECVEGFYSNQLGVYIFPGNGGRSVMATQTERLLIDAGSSVQKTVSLDMASLDQGDYIAAVYNGNSQASSPIYFKIADPQGVGDAAAAQAPAQLYDLSGRPVDAATAAPGLYISRQGKHLVR